MIFNSRSDIEVAGKDGVDIKEHNGNTYAKMLNMFYVAVDKDDHGFAPHAINDGFWEAWITLWMHKNVKENFSVCDIGANHGYYALMLASSGCVRVDAYEPQPKLAELIKKSVKFNNLNNLNTFDFAISDQNKDKGKMIVPIHHGMNATLTKPGYMPDGFEEINVKLTTLDSIDVKYDFIKMDAEGGEEDIWKGMQNYLIKYPDTLILMEWRYDRYKNPEKFAEDMFDKCSITNVDFDGGEQSIDLEKLYTKKNEDWMLVLRSK